MKVVCIMQQVDGKRKVKGLLYFHTPRLDSQLFVTAQEPGCNTPEHQQERTL